MDEIKILVINPGSTSTKIGVYLNIKAIFLKTINHSESELAKYNKIIDQLTFRKEIIIREIIKAEINLKKIQIIIGRGGLLKPIESGIYAINERMKEDLKNAKYGEHASNLGALLADELASELKNNVKAYIADPVVVDELEDVARISGNPEFTRKSIFHALNHKAVAREYAKSIHKDYENLNLIVAHMGGGISVGAHKKGRVIDVNQALDGEGPFSPERSGTLPAGDLAKYCFFKNKNYEDIKKMITGKGGYVAYLGTNSAYEVSIMAKAGNEKAALIQYAMAYQISKEIGAMATVLNGMVDAIILTGGIAHIDAIVKIIKQMTSFIAPVIVLPGGNEMNALAMNAYLASLNKITVKEYN